MANPSLGVAVIGAGMVGRAPPTLRQAGPCTGPGCRTSGWSRSRTRTSRSRSRPHAGSATSGPRRAGRRSRPPRTSTWSASRWPTRCTARWSRACSRRASTCSARSHWPRPSPTARPWWRAGESDRVAAIGFTFRRSPAINAVREKVRGGVLGPVRHFTGRYWCDYGADPDAPVSWRYRGGPGRVRSRTSAATWSTWASSSAGRWRRWPAPRSSPR